MCLDKGCSVQKEQNKLGQSGTVLKVTMPVSYSEERKSRLNHLGKNQTQGITKSKIPDCWISAGVKCHLASFFFFFFFF